MGIYKKILLNSQNKTALSAFAVIFFLVIFVLFLQIAVFLTNITNAQTQSNVHGWAWSDNIGWISFNCANTSSCSDVDYGVYFSDTGGELSGHAWSDNIGWISFNEDDLGGCPSGSCKAKLAGNNFQGWAKALAGGGLESGDWDGWISLKGSNPSYGVTLNENSLESFAWGSEVVGWIDFSPQFAGSGVFIGDIPTVDLSASPVVVNEGDTSTLSWTTQNVDTCTGTDGTPDWPGSKAISDTDVNVGPINSDTVYTLSCSGENGTVIDSETVFVSSESPDAPTTSLTADPTTVMVSGTSNLTWSSTDADDCSGVNFSTGGATSGNTTVSLSSTTIYTVVCTNESGLSDSSATVAITNPVNPTLSISANPTTVRSGNQSTITWSASDVDACSVTGPGGFSFSTLSGSELSGLITQKSTYNITCQAEGNPDVSDNVVVNLAPLFEEF
mgnify:CR=1 FL=1|tara:strand:- start:92 stop:1426 length:1335 start_codon:yes stop_codon:yes gene_type:complete